MNFIKLLPVPNRAICQCSSLFSVDYRLSFGERERRHTCMIIWICKGRSSGSTGRKFIRFLIHSHSHTLTLLSNAKLHQTILSVTGRVGTEGVRRLVFWKFNDFSLSCARAKSSTRAKKCFSTSNGEQPDENPWLTLNLFLNLFLTN